MPSDFLRQAAVLAGFIERYVLSIFYLVYASAIVWLFRSDWPLYLREDLHSGVPVIVNQTYAYIVSRVLLVMLLYFMGGVLLLGRRAVVTPRNVPELVVPMMAAFYYVLYDQFYNKHIPDAWKVNLAPESWQQTMTTIGLVLGAVGGAISVWGLISLGRYFGIFVGVRGIVLGGPYRFVRHPIYFGYIISFSGVAVALPCWFYLVLVPIHVGLFAWRAHLEEVRLAEFSAEYRENMKHTGFLMPRWRRAKAA